MPKYAKFTDFAEDFKIMDGQKRSIDSVLNVEILILKIRITKSKFKDDCLTVQYEHGGNKYIAFTGSHVLIEQLQKYENRLPFYATIIKIDKYYTLS